MRGDLTPFTDGGAGHVQAVSCVGVVVIGRNEGRRLERCLDALGSYRGRVVYVDSGSTDSSVEAARARGASVVSLDMGVPFTAARARNEGFRRLRKLCPQVSYVQFLDGDCELAADWMGRAYRHLDGHGDLAAVCGRRRERHPQRSVFNTLCDIEWDTPVGEARACGGDAMMRITALEQVGGFREDLIAGEEPELCVRLRAGGWRIWRLDAEMTLHDADMTRFGQWWKRSMRAGYAFAQGATLHGAPPERHWVRETRSAQLWAGVVPFVVVAISAGWGAWALACFLAYPLQVARIALRGHRSARENWLQATFLVLGKFAELCGQVRFYAQRRSGGTARLIEYK